MHRLCFRDSTPRPMGPFAPAEHRELADLLARALGPRGRDVLPALVHGRPALFAGETLDAGLLSTAGIELASCEPAPPRDRSPEAARAVADALEGLAAALARRAPDAPRLWAAPAWSEDVEMLEATVGGLPDALVSLLARHDGALGRLGKWELRSAASIESCWRDHQALAGQLAEVDSLAAPDPGVQGRWWCPGWLPLAGDGAGNELCVDLSPAPGGTPGQLVEYVHDHGARPRVAAGLAPWLEAQAAALDCGDLVVVEKADGSYDGLMERSRLKGLSLALLRVRGESEDERRRRLEQDVLGDSAVLTGVVLDVLRLEKRLQLRPGAVEPLTLWPLAQRILAGTDALELRLRRLLAALARSADVDELDVTIEELVHEVKAALR